MTIIDDFYRNVNENLNEGVKLDEDDLPDLSDIEYEIDWESLREKLEGDSVLFRHLPAGFLFLFLCFSFIFWSCIFTFSN